jgi:hypothetical protein
MSVGCTSGAGTFGYRTRDDPACSAVPQPTAPLRTTPYFVLGRITVYQINVRFNDVYSAPNLDVNKLVLLLVERIEKEFIGFVS